MLLQTQQLEEVSQQELRLSQQKRKRFETRLRDYEQVLLPRFEAAKQAYSSFVTELSELVEEVHGVICLSLSHRFVVGPSRSASTLARS